MYTLLLDSSASSLAVGFLKDRKLFCETSFEAWQSQSEHMIPEINKLMENFSIHSNEIKEIIVSIGPGSYTGVRIAITIAKTISLALTIPVYTVSSLRVLKDNEKPSICLINARSGRSYFGVYKDKEILIADSIKTNDEVLKYIDEHKEYSICGDARYLGYPNNDTGICKQMASLRSSLSPLEDSLGLKPIYMKD